MIIDAVYAAIKKEQREMWAIRPQGSFEITVYMTKLFFDLAMDELHNNDQLHNSTWANGQGNVMGHRFYVIDGMSDHPDFRIFGEFI